MQLLRKAVQCAQSTWWEGAARSKEGGSDHSQWSQEKVSAAHLHCETSALKGMQHLQHPTAPSRSTPALYHKQGYTHL